MVDFKKLSVESQCIGGLKHSIVETQDVDSNEGYSFID